MAYITFLQRVNLFKTLSLEELEAMRSIFLERDFKKNQVVFYEEDAGKIVYVVKYGELKVIQSAPDGKENILAIHCSGDTFGEMSMLDGKSTPARVTAKEDCRIICISKHNFETVLMKNRRFVENLLIQMCGTLRRAWKTIQVLKYNEAGQRIKQLLLNFAEEDGRQRPDGVALSVRITHQEISEMVGVSRETVSRTLSKLQRMKAMTTEHHRFVLLDHPFWSVP